MQYPLLHATADIEVYLNVPIDTFFRRPDMDGFTLQPRPPGCSPAVAAIARPQVFNDFRRRRPWISPQFLRPKGIALELPLGSTRWGPWGPRVRGEKRRPVGLLGEDPVSLVDHSLVCQIVEGTGTDMSFVGLRFKTGHLMVSMVGEWGHSSKLLVTHHGIVWYCQTRRFLENANTIQGVVFLQSSL